MPSHSDTHPSAPIDILWLLIAYNNLEEVDEYIDQLDSIKEERSIYRYAITDNSPTTGVSKHADRSDVAFVARTDNPGYLDGGRAALSAARDVGWASERWVALSNTDLLWTSGDPAPRLGEHRHEAPCIIAPRVTEGSPPIDKNPHVIRRRTSRRLALNYVATSTVATSLVYHLAALIRSRLGRGTSADRRTPSAWARQYPPGTEFYSPYGAVMFFSQGFDAENSLPANVPLLSEEYFIAEAASRIPAPVVYEPRIHAFHDAHTTTGPKIHPRRARGTRTAFKAIYTDSRGGHR